VDLSAAQDIEAGDGTTSVVVLAGSLLGAAEKMLQKGMHPTIIAEAFLKASVKSVEYLTEMSTPVDLNDRPSLLRAASTSLNSKVIITNQHHFEQQLISCPITDCVAIFIDVGPNCGCGCNSSSHSHIVDG
jgi:chaperonin GroEL (HSP60 family)